MASAQIQGDLWGSRAREWAELQEGSFRPLYEAAFTATHVGMAHCFSMSDAVLDRPLLRPNNVAPKLAGSMPQPV